MEGKLASPSFVGWGEAKPVQLAGRSKDWYLSLLYLGWAWSWVCGVGKVAGKGRTDRHWDLKGRWEWTSLLLWEDGTEEERGSDDSQRDQSIRGRVWGLLLR